MPLPVFRGNDWPTLGVELELQLVDARTMELRSAIGSILADLPGHLTDWVKPEFMQCYVEINSEVGRTVDDIGFDLDHKVRAVDAIARRQGLGLLWAGTHPFSRWQDQRITPNERYYKLADLLGETVIRPVTFGLHIHVGVPSGDLAVQVMTRLEEHLPVLLALSSNSPFWHGRLTGHHAHRIEILEGFPTGGLAPRLARWADYTTLVDRLITAGFIESHRELWWDVRPGSGSGTVEVRICDMPPDLPSVLGLTALVQCLVHDLCAKVHSGAGHAEDHPLMARQNRWRACRFGMGAEFVSPVTLEALPARLVAERLVWRLRDTAEELGCAAHLDHVLTMADTPTGAEHQVALFEQTGDLSEVVRRQLSAHRVNSLDDAQLSAIS